MNSYRPRLLEERIRRTHTKFLESQIESIAKLKRQNMIKSLTDKVQQRESLKAELNNIANGEINTTAVNNQTIINPVVGSNQTITVKIKNKPGVVSDQSSLSSPAKDQQQKQQQQLQQQQLEEQIMINSDMNIINNNNIQNHQQNMQNKKGTIKVHKINKNQNNQSNSHQHII